MRIALGSRRRTAGRAAASLAAALIVLGASATVAEPQTANAATSATPQAKSGAKPKKSTKNQSKKTRSAQGVNLYKRIAKLGIPAPGEITVTRFVVDVVQPRKRGGRNVQAFRPAIAIPASEIPAGVTVVGGIWTAKNRADRAIAVIVLLRAAQAPVTDRSLDLRFWSQLRFHSVARTQAKNVVARPRKASCLLGLDGRMSKVGTTQLRGPAITLDSSRRWSLGLSGLRPRQILRAALYAGCGHHGSPFYGVVSAALRSEVPLAPSGGGIPGPGPPDPNGDPDDPSPDPEPGGDPDPDPDADPDPGSPPGPGGNQSCTLAAATFDSTQMVVEIADCDEDIGKIVIDSVGISIASHIFPDGTCTTAGAIVCTADPDVRETAMLVEYAKAVPANTRITGRVDDFDFDIPLT